MSTAEILLEYRQSEKVKRHLRVTSDQPLFVIGSSKKADLRLQGEDINGCHAVLRYRHPHWYVCDVSNVDAHEVEKQLDESAVIEIGKHQLRLFQNDKNVTLFKENEEASKKLSLHQAVVFYKGRVVESHVFEASQNFIFGYDSDRVVLPAPSNGQWKITEVGSRTVQQRLIPEQELVGAERFAVDQGLKKPLMILLSVVMLLCLIAALLPHSKEPTREAVLDNKSLEMIYNAKTILKKRVEAKKMVAARMKSGGNAGPTSSEVKSVAKSEESQAPKMSSKATAALSSLRASGLNSLIGKIAKRASKTNEKIAAEGVSPDNANSGRTFYSNGNSTVAGGGAASKAGSSFKLGGVATRGFGGGATNLKDGTSLSGGGVGQAAVAVAEEDTVIEGGLDREVIADVIRRNLGQIRYCYERQLSSNKDLYGKIMVKWNIDAAGSVGDARIENTTMNSAMVEGCVLRRISGWKFPLPKGGTIVKVSYPFLFKAQ
jgi:outer membrane biosynthesis protein TonB